MCHGCLVVLFSGQVLCVFVIAQVCSHEDEAELDAVIPGPE